MTWRRLLVAAAAGLVVLSLGQAILRGDREAVALALVIVVGLILWRRGTGLLAAHWASRAVLPCERSGTGPCPGSSLRF